MKRISFTKYFVFRLKSGWNSTLYNHVKNEAKANLPAWDLSLWLIVGPSVYVCGLSHGANQPAAGQTCLTLQTHSAISTSLTSNRSSYQDLKLPLQSTRVRPYSTALVQKNMVHHRSTRQQVISEHRAREEGGSTVLLLSKQFSTIGSNQPAIQAYTGATVERG